MIEFNILLKEILISCMYGTVFFVCIFIVLMLAMALIGIYRDNFQ